MITSEELRAQADQIILRARRFVAYDAGKYKFQPPPVPCNMWSKADWCNWVRFEDQSLNVFLSPSPLLDGIALNIQHHNL